MLLAGPLNVRLVTAIDGVLAAANEVEGAKPPAPLNVKLPTVNGCVVKPAPVFPFPTVFVAELATVKLLMAPAPTPLTVPLVRVTAGVSAVELFCNNVAGVVAVPRVMLLVPVKLEAPFICSVPALTTVGPVKYLARKSW